MRASVATLLKSNFKSFPSRRDKNFVMMIPWGHKKQTKCSAAFPCCLFPRVHVPPSYLLHFPTLYLARRRLKCDDTHAENRFRLSAKRTSPFKSAGASVQSTTGSRGVRISGTNVGYNTFRGSVKGTGYPLTFTVFPFTSLSPCVAVCHHISTGLYHLTFTGRATGHTLGNFRAANFYNSTVPFIIRVQCLSLQPLHPLLSFFLSLTLSLSLLVFKGL